MTVRRYCFGIRSERRLCEEVHLNLCVIDGRSTTIQACDIRRLRNEIVLHMIQVRG